MIRSKFLSSVFSLTTIAWSAIAGHAVADPNVIVFLVDDMGWTDWQRDASLNPQGSVVYETPNMLRLAQAGTVFNNAYAASPLCSPTRVSLVTGRNPAQTRITDYIPGGGFGTTSLSQPAWTKNLSAADVTLAEALRSAGYATGFFGKWHLGESGNAANPLANGFDVNVGGTNAGNPNFAGGYFAGSDGMWSGMPGLSTPGEFASSVYLNDALTQKAEDFIQQRADAPFFMMMSHYAVHTPLQAPQSLVTKYQQKIATLQSQSVNLQNHTNATYAAMVEKMDQSLGDLLDRLDDPNGDGNQGDSIRSDTLIVFASDNGGLWSAEGSPTRNLPLREGKGSMYEGGIREPFIMSWTGNAATGRAVVSNARTMTQDIYATVLDAAGVLGNPTVQQNVGLDGVSIMDAFEGQAFDRGFQYWHYPHISPQDNGAANIVGGTFVSAVRKDDWKLLFFYNDRHYELYNLAVDVSETTNVLAANPQAGFELSAALNNFLGGANAQMPISNSTGQPVALPPVLLPGLLGDFNQTGAIDEFDWVLLRSNLFRNASNLDAAGAYAIGDITFDRRIDQFDFSAFKLAYNAANGQGAFEKLTASVPEPSSLAACAVGALGMHYLQTRLRQPSCVATAQVDDRQNLVER